MPPTRQNWRQEEKGGGGRGKDLRSEAKQVRGGFRKKNRAKRAPCPYHHQQQNKNKY